MTPQAFCDRAVKLGTDNLAKCTPDDKNVVAYLDLQKNQGLAKDACAKLVGSANVELHASVASSCLEAAEKLAGNTTFATLGMLPECAGLLTGKVAEGQPATFGEECAPGLGLLKGKCTKPVALNATCGASGSLGKREDHPLCEAGLICSTHGSETDGNLPDYRCIKPRDVGGACSAGAEDCPDDTHCSQGKCKTKAAAGEQCMDDYDCRIPNVCFIEGGVFGKCVAPIVAGEKCDRHEQCASSHCLNKKCAAFCGSK